MGSRIRENADHIFLCFCEVVIPTTKDMQPWVLQKYPEKFDNEEILKSVPEFSYPCEFTNDAVQHFSFVLTSLDSKWTYGFCRHTPNQPTLFCFLSFLPWHETFYRLLNQVADIVNNSQSGLLHQFLDILYSNVVPEPGTELHVICNLKDFHAPCPNHLKLPSIPENRNLTEYFNAVDAHNMIVIFASMLHERRILITSRKLSRLSSCVQAANSLIYPMYWQHIFIPVLPKHLLDYVSAPMPFLIGVPAVTMQQVKHSELSEVVVLNADTNIIQTPFKDFEALPTEIVTQLKRSLKNQVLMIGDGLARAFMRALVCLIGGYREALKMTLGEKITFNEEAFIKSRTSSIQTFLGTMLHLQIFQQFIEDRLEMLNSGTGFSDEFEQEVSLFEGNSNARVWSQYREWATTMKKEGGLFLKNVRSKVKDRSKRAYKDIRSKIQDMQRHPSQPDLRYQQKVSKPKSAPSSPTFRPKAFNFPSRMSYNQNSSKKSAVGDSVNLSNSVTISGFRRYKVLTLDDVASEESLSDNEENHAVQRLDMDLMGDLQDILFRKCSTSDSQTDLTDNRISQTGKKKDDKVFGFEDSFCEADVFLPAPMPPPRTKKKQIEPRNNNVFVPNVHETYETNDKPLIRLDSLDDFLFDPLEEKSFVNEKAIPTSAFKTPQEDSLLRLQKSTFFTSDVSSQQNDFGKSFMQNNVPTEVESKPPPLPPKKGGNLLLSKSDKDLLEDYGLGGAPIFQAVHFEESKFRSGSPQQNSSAKTTTVSDLIDIFNNDVPSKNTQDPAGRSNWQKFV